MTKDIIKTRAHNFQDLTGRKFGKLTIISFSHSINGQQYWLCKCDCGKEKAIRAGHFKSGKTLSCGCLRHIAHNFLHGATSNGRQTPEYKAWAELKNRCYNINGNRYHRYGGRGITICDRWENSFENFLEDMGLRPSSQHSIDRRNNDSNYEPSNCKWSVRKEQCRNRSTNRFLSYQGETLTIAEWSERLGIKYHTIISRLWNGLSTEEALNTYVVKRNRIYGKKKDAVYT